MTKILENNLLDGIQIISALDVNQVPAGVHQYWFRATTNALMQWQHLPIWVFKGEKKGKKIMITAAVHGDEYNGVLTAQKIAQSLIDEAIAGCVTIVPTLNLSGLLHHSRDFHSSDPDVSDGNLNRHFPGNHQGNEPQRYLAHIWDGLLKDNADLAIDLHTQTSGTVYPLYLFADFRIPDALQMARLMQPDAILDDPGEAGVLETVWNQHGIPSITAEIGVGRYTDLPMVERATNGVMNVLRHYGVISGESILTQNAIESAVVTSIRAEMGGFILPQVELMQTVEEGQVLALQYDSFGVLCHEYKAPRAGTVLSHNVESMRAAGALVVRLIHH